MKKLFAVMASALPLLALAAPDTWTIDIAHSSTAFSVKHLVISTVRGHFDRTSGELKLDPADPARSSVQATIDAASIDTREPKRDDHLRSADFLDVARYPTITFRSTKVAPGADGKLSVSGDLTLRGVTRPVTLEVTTSPEVKGMGGETRRGFTATTTISRKQFGLAWNKAVEAGPVVADEVAITLDLEGVQKPAAAPTN